MNICTSFQNLCKYGFLFAHQRPLKNFEIVGSYPVLPINIDCDCRWRVYLVRCIYSILGSIVSG